MLEIPGSALRRMKLSCGRGKGKAAPPAMSISNESVAVKADRDDDKERTADLHTTEFLLEEMAQALRHQNFFTIPQAPRPHRHTVVGQSRLTVPEALPNLVRSHRKDLFVPGKLYISVAYCVECVLRIEAIDVLNLVGNPARFRIPALHQSLVVKGNEAFQGDDEADDFFLANLHSTAEVAVGRGMQPGGFNQIGAPGENTGRLRAANPFSTADRHQISSR